MTADTHETTHARLLAAYRALWVEDTTPETEAAETAAYALLEAEQKRLLAWGAMLGGEVGKICEGGAYGPMREGFCTRLAKLEALTKIP